MGYYYVMLFPFLIVEVLPKRRFDLALVSLIVTTWISLSPYYAAWDEPGPLVGSRCSAQLNSLFFGVAVRPAVEIAVLETDQASRKRSNCLTSGGRYWSLRLVRRRGLGGFMQPLAHNSASPIRAPSSRRNGMNALLAVRCAPGSR